ncbi:hypothetical protein OG981_50215 [Streptomyces mirabilis]|uniref:hypothetical protein n=1 Tax=Streptomyces mirabilis TaxID=68239 RepID=UPI000765E6BC|nr:hypothetical protein [Streptomyces mirabilis]
MDGGGLKEWVAGLVTQWKVDGCVVADAPDEWLGFNEAPECDDEAGYRPVRCRADAFRSSGHVHCLGGLVGDPEQVSDLMPMGINHA